MRVGGLLKALTVIATFMANIFSEIQFFTDSIFNFKYNIKKMGLNNNDPEFSKNIVIESSTHKDKLEQEKSLQSSKNEIQIIFKKIKLNNFVTENKSKDQALGSIQDDSQVKIDNSNNNNKLKNLNVNMPFSNNKTNNFNNNVISIKIPNNINTNNIGIEAEKARINNNKPNDVLQAQNNHEKSGLFLSTIVYYSTFSIFKDFISQLFGMMFCNCSCSWNKKILQEKKMYLEKINQIFSINYMLKKFFFVEQLMMKNLTKSELSILEGSFYQQLLVESKTNKKASPDFVFNFS